MKKSAVFIFVFTLTTIICSLVLRVQYMNFSHKTFTKVTTAVKNCADNVYAAFNKSALLEENEQLKKELSVKKSYIEKNKILEKENENLYKLLKLTKSYPNKTQIPANVIRINTIDGFNLIVDRGKNHGVKVGNVALWGDALVGKVSETFDDFSCVVPITAPDIATGIANEEGDAGLVLGSAKMYQKNMCELSFFSNAVKISEGSTVTTSGLSDTYPKGLLVGKVQKENGVAFIKTEVDFFKIRTISLIG